VSYSGKHGTGHSRRKEDNDTAHQKKSQRLFTVLSIVVVTTIGLIIGFFMSGQIRDSMINNYAKYNAVQVTGNITTAFSNNDVKEPLRGSGLSHLQEHTKHALMDTDIKSIRFWNTDGLILFSTSKDQIGNITEDGKSLAGKFVADPEKKLINTTVKNSSGERMVTYYPVFLDKANPNQVSAVYEVSMSLDGLQSSINAVMRTVVIGLGSLIIALVLIAQVTSIMLRNRNLKLKNLTAKLAIKADTDGLTGLNNHLHFQNALKDQVEKAQRINSKLSVVMIDLDRFKNVNDRYGHQTGDKVLKKVAGIFDKVLRETDFSARYGGEEFVAVLPDTNSTDALSFAERLRKSAEELTFGDESEKTAALNITLSCGVAEFPEHGNDPSALVAAADSALLFAKNHGRNQVRSFNEFASSDIEEEDLERLINRLQNASLKTVQALAAAVDTKDQFRSAATNSSITANFAGRLNLDKDSMATLSLATQLHDVGEATIPGQVLNKSASLSENEMDSIRTHPEASVKIVEAASQTQSLLGAILHHHENWDGTGYPDGLKGSEIPYLARMLRIVDSFEAMTTERPYRNAMTTNEATKELERNAGTQFDPEMVTAFIETIAPTEGVIKESIHVSTATRRDEKATA